MGTSPPKKSGRRKARSAHDKDSQRPEVTSEKMSDTQKPPTSPTSWRPSSTPKRMEITSGETHSDTQGPPTRPTSQRSSSTPKLRGRLGHLVSAIQEAHKASSSAGDISEHCYTPSLQEQKQAWSAIAHNSKPSVHEHLHDSPSSSYSDVIEERPVHTCMKCDRMYPSRSELNKHLLECSM